MRESKYPGKPTIKIVRVDKFDLGPLLRYMEEARKIMVAQKKHEEQRISEKVKI